MKLNETARRILTGCLAAKAGEAVLVVTDDTRLAIGTAFYEAAQNLGCRAMLMRMPEGTVNGEEPPEAVAAAMAAADIVLCPTAKSLTHTNARITASRAGARIATMPGITEDMFSEGAMTADYETVQQLTQRVAELLSNASTARIEKDGCSLSLDLRGRKGVASTGVYPEPGNSGNLPSGEAYIAPVEGGTCGQVVVDGSMVGIGMLSAPLRFTIKDGKLCNIEGDESGALGVLMKNEANATVGELGIGTNSAAILKGIILEDEKVYGTVHIAFGTNTSFGGVNKAGCHMDGVILKPTLYLDEKIVIDKGTFVLDQ